VKRRSQNRLPHPIESPPTLQLKEDYQRGQVQEKIGENSRTHNPSSESAEGREKGGGGRILSGISEMKLKKKR